MTGKAPAKKPAARASGAKSSGRTAKVCVSLSVICSGTSCIHSLDLRRPRSRNRAPSRLFPYFLVSVPLVSFCPPPLPTDSYLVTLNMPMYVCMPARRASVRRCVHTGGGSRPLPYLRRRHVASRILMYQYRFPRAPQRWEDSSRRMYTHVSYGYPS